MLESGRAPALRTEAVRTGPGTGGVSSGLKNLVVADEALMLAKALRESGHLDEAIKVGERGLKLAGQKVALGEWLGAIEEARGRTKQATEAWLAAFSDDPSLAALSDDQATGRGRGGGDCNLR